MAIKDVITVPTIKDSAPYFSLPSVGFHSEELINSMKPNFSNAGIAPVTREYSMPPVITKITEDLIKLLSK